MDQEKKVDIRWSESTNMSAPHTPIIESTSGCLVLSFRDPGPMLETENLGGLSAIADPSRTSGLRGVQAEEVVDKLIEIDALAKTSQSHGLMETNDTSLQSGASSPS